MTPRLYLHIGAHKTATTAIQRTFWQARKTLAKAGVLYPQAGRYHFAQHRLSFALKGKTDPDRGDVPDFDTEMAALRAEVRDGSPRAVFVSSEDFFAMRVDRIRRLAAAVDFAEFHVVGVVRRQDDFLLSLYNQNVKAVGNAFFRPLEDFVADPRAISREMSFLDCLTKWERGVGRGRMHLRRYEDAPPVAAMLEVLGLPPDTLPPPERRANESLPAAAIEAIRRAKADGLPPEAQRQVAARARREFEGQPKLVLAPGERRRILQVFAEENATLFARFGMENTYGPDRVEAP